MKITLWLCILFTYACNNTQNTKRDYNSEIVIKKNVQPSAKQKDCDADFDIFFKMFQADSLFQVEHTKFPIKYTYVDDVDDEYKVVRNDIIKDKFYFVDFSGDKEALERKSARFSIKINKSKDSVLYLRKGIDNGIYEEIKFAFEKGCWHLVEMNDCSM